MKSGGLPGRAAGGEVVLRQIALDQEHDGFNLVGDVVPQQEEVDKLIEELLVADGGRSERLALLSTDL